MTDSVAKAEGHSAGSEPSREGTVSYDRVRRFLNLEAQLADEHRYDEWLSLWDSEEILYWIPINSDDYDPATHISLVLEDRQGLENRIARLKGRNAHAQRPRSRVRRLVSNIDIDPTADGATVHVECNFIICELRNKSQDTFSGRASYELRLDGEKLAIKRKKVMLLANDEFIDNLSFLI